jgi:hypothetical protein
METIVIVCDDEKLAKKTFSLACAYAGNFVDLLDGSVCHELVTGTWSGNEVPSN